MTKQFKHVETKLIHAGEPEPRILGAVSMPIFQIGDVRIRRRGELP